MNSDNNNNFPDLLRRKLIVALPVGVVGFYMASTLVGCGGGGGNPDDGTPSDTGGTFNGTESLRSVAVTVEVPAGVAIPMNGWLAVHTLLGGFGVVENGVATINMLDRGPQLATVYFSYGLPILFGFVGSDQAALSSHTTAVVLLSFALGAEWLDGTAVAALRASLATTIAATTLAEAIEAALVADNTALGQMNPQIVEATQQAVLSLLPNVQSQTSLPRSLARGLTVNPPDAKSGLQPIIADQLNTLYIQNDKLRRANYLIRRTGYLPATATSSAEVVALADKPVVANGTIPLPPAFDSVSGSISAVIQDYYSQGDGADESLGSLAFSKSPLVPLTVEPADAKRTRYEVVVLTAGNPLLAIDETVYGSLPEANKLMITDFQPENLGLKMLVVDVLIPLFLTVLGNKIKENIGSLGPREFKERLEAGVFMEVVTVFLTTLPGVVEKLRKKKYGWGDAALDICRNRLVDFQEMLLPDGRTIPVPMLTKFSISMLTLLLKFIGHEVLDGKAGEGLLNFIEGNPNADPAHSNTFTAPNVNTGKMEEFTFQWGGKEGEQLRQMGVAKVLDLLGKVDAGLSILSKMRIFFDMSTSLPLEAWEVWTNSAKVRLTPDPFEVDISGTYALTVEIVDNDDDVYGNEKGSFSFDWVCTALAGDLYKRGSSSETNTFTTSNANATVDYVPRGAEPAAGVAETVTVTAYFEPIGIKRPRELIGKFTLPVKFKKAFNLVVNPPGPANMPVDSNMTIVALVKEKLPAGATVDWEWSHSGLGSIAVSEADSNPGDSSVMFTSPSGEGTATVTVSARINLVAAGGQPPRSVLADPVSTTLNVKKGLKEIVMEVSGGMFACSDPKACGVSYYGAYLVPVLPKAISYKAVFSGFGYAGCNRSVTWNSPKGDGGGCNFPITYHPHNSVGATNLWALWMGWGDATTPWNPGGGKCVVTITLAP